MTGINLKTFLNFRPGPIYGKVMSFESENGLGTIGARDFPEPIGFQLTEIADNSRKIDPGKKVSFLLGYKGGAFEATSIVPLEELEI